jgi:hypothetical protein
LFDAVPVTFVPVVPLYIGFADFSSCLVPGNPLIALACSGAHWKKAARGPILFDVAELSA